MSGARIELFQPVHLPVMEDAALEVIRSGQIAAGSSVAAFEESFAAIAGRGHMVSTSDLTSAVTLALHLSGVRSGDSVATLAFSCLQSNSPIVKLGARPVWIDIDPGTLSMSLNDLSSKLTPSVKAVMVYHVAGYPADTDRISTLCQERGIPLIEDCNNAIGARLNGASIGSFGDYAVYSFYPNRQINGFDGGMLSTPNSEAAARASRLRRFGIDAQSFRDTRGEINPNSDVAEIGWSASLSNLHAAVALSQLDSLQNRLDRTFTLATNLINEISLLKKVRPIEPLSGGRSAFWGCLVLADDRDDFLAYLKERGIKASILHQRNDHYSGFGNEQTFLPGTDMVMEKILALPCGWWLSNKQFDKIVTAIRDYDRF